MPKHRDLLDMIEIVTTTIEIHAKEEEFFRRSAAASTSEVAKNLFSEIADDLGKYRKNLESRRQKLWDALSDLETAERAGN